MILPVWRSTFLALLYSIRLREPNPIFLVRLALKLIFATRTSQSSALPSQSGAPSAGSSKHIGIGVIVGIAVSFHALIAAMQSYIMHILKVGAIFILFAFVALLFYCRRQRRDMG
jgi:hypothetical protein